MTSDQEKFLSTGFCGVTVLICTVRDGQMVSYCTHHQGVLRVHIFVNPLFYLCVRFQFYIFFLS